MAKQLNVFVENKPGRFKKITEILFKNQINIRAIEVQDRGEFGVMKLLVNDPRKANIALSEAGIATALQNVIAISIDDVPGALFKLADFFDTQHINMLDAYGFVMQSTKQAVWCAEVEETDQVIALLEKNGFNVLDDAELYDA